MKPLLLILLVSLNLFGGVESFEKFVQEEIDDERPPSASFAVLRGDKILYESSLGFNDAEKSQPTSLESTYHIYSVTKILAATLAMQLADKGILSLDNTIDQYYPRFKARYEGREVKVTLLNLLNHSSGITDRSTEVRPMTDDHYYAYAKANGIDVAEYIELPYLPGSEASYSSAEYIILSRIMEKATGETFDAMIKEHILRPAHMQRSGFTYSDEMAKDQVHGTLQFFSIIGTIMRLMMDDKNKDHYEGTTLWLKQFDVGWLAAGGLVSSIHDMALFLSAYNNCILMDAETKKRLLNTPAVPVDSWLSSQDKVTFGIGWYHIEDKGEFFYQHQGLGPGFRTIMRVYPEYDISFVILTSQSETDIDAWADRLIDDVKGGLF